LHSFPSVLDSKDCRQFATALPQVGAGILIAVRAYKELLESRFTGSQLNRG